MIVFGDCTRWGTFEYGELSLRLASEHDRPEVKTRKIKMKAMKKMDAVDREKERKREEEEKANGQ